MFMQTGFIWLNVETDEFFEHDNERIYSIK